MLSINRSTYYRHVFCGDAQRRVSANMVLVNPLLRTVAESNPSLGYRRVWAKAKASGYNKSISTAYR